MLIRFDIDEEYARSQFLEGYELPLDYAFECDVTTLTREQRQALLDVFPKTGDGKFMEGIGVPDEIRLPVPLYYEDLNEIRDGFWVAQINPEVLDATQIIENWMQHCVEALKVAEAEYEKH